MRGNFLKFLVGITILLLGIPGMISDFHTWLTWLKGWAAWNYLVTGIGFLMSSWAIFGIYQDYKAKVTQEAIERTHASKEARKIYLEIYRRHKPVFGQRKQMVRRS